MPWPQTGAIQYHAKLGLPNKGRTIKWLIIWNDCDLEPLDLLYSLAQGYYQPCPWVMNRTPYLKYLNSKSSLQSILFPTKIKNIDDTFLAGMGRFWNAGCDMKLVELTGTALSMGGRGTRGRGGPPIAWFVIRFTQYINVNNLDVIFFGSGRFFHITYFFYVFSSIVTVPYF